MRTALVTGANGFTGGALVDRLCRDGWRVVSFSRPSSSTERFERLGVDYRLLDITDRQQVSDQFPDVDVVFHIAAAYRTEHADRDEFKRVNVDATEYLLEAAKQRGIKRFVHCSTVGVHGDIEDPPADETYRFAPNDHYQESKLEGERVALKYFAEGLPGTVVRPTAIYGPGDTRFLKLFRAIKSGAFFMIGDGKTLYHMNYIDDLVDGFLLASEHPDAIGEVFILGGERYPTITELVEEVARAVGKKPPRFRLPLGPVQAAAVVCEKACGMIGVAPPLYPRRVEFFAMSRAFSIDKAKRLLGYVPSIDLRTGIERTAAWYRTSGML